MQIDLIIIKRLKKPHLVKKPQKVNLKNVVKVQDSYELNEICHNKNLNQIHAQRSCLVFCDAKCKTVLILNQGDYKGALESHYSENQIIFLLTAYFHPQKYTLKPKFNFLLFILAKFQPASSLPKRSISVRNRNFESCPELLLNS